MRRSGSFAARVATAVAGLVFALATSPTLASEPTAKPFPSMQPTVQLNNLPDFRTSLDDGDEIATLDAIHLALTQVGDGGSYVWHRNHGRLSGVFQPTQSFKDAGGQVCRHLVVMLVAGAAIRKAESVACRLPDGRWQLDG